MGVPLVEFGAVTPHNVAATAVEVGAKEQDMTRFASGFASVAYQQGDLDVALERDMIDNQAIEPDAGFKFAFVVPEREIELFPAQFFIVELVGPSGFLWASVERSHIGIAAQAAHDMES